LISGCTLPEINSNCNLHHSYFSLLLAEIAIEAHIIAIACSAPPEGFTRWSMKMIADKIVLDGVVESISDETVRQRLKKINSNPT